MLQGLQLRRAILQALSDHKKAQPETPIKQEELSKKLQVDLDRLEAHFTVMSRSGHVSFLRMPGPTGDRMTFVEITPEGEKYLKNPKNFEAAKAGMESPFKVVAGGAEKPMTDLKELRKYVSETEWVIDEEKPEILAKLDELNRVLQDEKFDPGAVSGLKLYFERHKWLNKHVEATIRAKYGM